MRSTKDTDAASISAVSFTVESLLGQIHRKLETIAGPHRDSSQNIVADKQLVDVLVREIVERQMNMQPNFQPKHLFDKHLTPEDYYLENSPRQIEGQYSDEYSPNGMLPIAHRGKSMVGLRAAANSAVHEAVVPFNSIRDMPTARSQQVFLKGLTSDAIDEDLRHTFG